MKIDLLKARTLYKNKYLLDEELVAIATHKLHIRRFWTFATAVG